MEAKKNKCGFTCFVLYELGKVLVTALYITL